MCTFGAVPRKPTLISERVLAYGRSARAAAAAAASSSFLLSVSLEGVNALKAAQHSKHLRRRSLSLSVSCSNSSDPKCFFGGISCESAPTDCAGVIADGWNFGILANRFAIL